MAKYGRTTNAIYCRITILLAALYVDIISLCIFLWTVAGFFLKLVYFRYSSIRGYQFFFPFFLFFFFFFEKWHLMAAYQAGLEKKEKIVYR